jgi:hypothetical protein
MGRLAARSAAATTKLPTLHPCSSVVCLTTPSDPPFNARGAIWIGCHTTLPSAWNVRLKAGQTKGSCRRYSPARNMVADLRIDHDRRSVAVSYRSPTRARREQTSNLDQVVGAYGSGVAVKMLSGLSVASHRVSGRTSSDSPRAAQSAQAVAKHRLPIAEVLRHPPSHAATIDTRTCFSRRPNALASKGTRVSLP